MSGQPEGQITNRLLRFYWVLDISGSMRGANIGALNHAVREALVAMRRAADDHPGVSVEIRVMTFGSGARWMTSDPVPLSEFSWRDVGINGVTDMGAALQAMAVELAADAMPDSALPPVIVLVTDGQPTDDFDEGLAALLSEPWGRKAVRIAVAIGDAELEVLRLFIGDPAIDVLTAGSANDLLAHIRWVSTEVFRAASEPAGWVHGEPAVPARAAGDSGTEVIW